jgi:hypothetical protein
MAFKRSPPTIKTIIANHACRKMSERKLYEQLIADKLQQLPVPDADAGWQQMKRLLDEDETPRGGGRIPGPRGKWWWVGFAALLVSTGAVFYYHKGDAAIVSKEQLAVNGTTNNKSIVGKDNTQTDKTSIVTGLNNTPNNKQNINNNNTNSVSTNITTTSNGAIKNNNVADNIASTVTDKKTIVKPFNKNSTTNTAALSTNSGNTSVAPVNNMVANKTVKNNNRTVNGTTVKNVMPKQAGSPIAANNKTGLAPKQHNIANNKVAINVQAGLSNQPANNENVILLDEVVVEKQQQRMRLLQTLTIKNKPVTPINGLVLHMVPAEKDAALNAVDEVAVAETIKKLKQAEKELKKEERKERRAFNMEKVFKPFSLKADGEPWWAVGLALNAGITTGSQERINYNNSAKTSTVSDYLPSPFVQYHVNDNVFIQTEINLSMPQYTPRLLLFQNEMSNVSGNTLSKSVYVQKLYYFSWPVSLHYSPLKNLYFNGGLQFSSFQSGIALIQQSNQNNQVIKSDVLRFRDDSIAARLTPTEWRWQTGADYYMNRFTFGLRYNKSFKDLINLHLNNSLPPTISRNNAMLFYMRYNLFDGRGSRNSSSNSSLVHW